MKFARFQTGGQIKYGIAEGENIREIQGDLFGNHTRRYGLCHQHRQTAGAVHAQQTPGAGPQLCAPRGGKRYGA